MSNFKLGFFAPFSEYHFLFFINSQRPHVVDGGWVSSAGLFFWPWPVPCKPLVWWDLVILYNNYSLKQDVEYPRGVLCPSGNLNCLTNLSLTTRPFRYDLNQIPYNYTVEVTNRCKGLDLIECLKNYGRRFVTLYRSQWLRPSPWKGNAKRQNCCLRRAYK